MIGTSLVGKPITNSLTVSVVSHGHSKLLASLINQLLEFVEIVEVIITLNTAEDSLNYADPRVTIIRNSRSLGFGANHNQAFKRCSSDFFCVLNPDVVFLNNPFPKLLWAFKNENVGLVAPAVIAKDGFIEDSARKFPTLSSLIFKVFGVEGDSVYKNFDREISSIEWCAGMFQLFRCCAFDDVDGFDQRYHLYYEDVDICARLWRANWYVVINSQVQIVHEGRRDSHRSFTYFKMHLKSLCIYMKKYGLGYYLPKKLAVE